MAAVQAGNPGMRPVNMPHHLQQQLQAHPGPQAQAIQQQHIAQQQMYQQQMVAQANNNAQMQANQQRAGAQQPQVIHDGQNMTPHPQSQPPSQASSVEPGQPGQQPHQQQVINPQAQTPQNHQQQPTQMSAQEAQFRAQQQQNATAGMMLQQRMNSMKRSSVLRLNAFAENLSGYSVSWSASLSFNEHQTNCRFTSFV
jgi:hypothetical protein